jgi:hypothetical protein
MSDMSFAAVRGRLRNPVNAVVDIPIDLKPKRYRPEPMPPMPLKIGPVTPYIHTRRYPSLEDITRVVCDHYNVTPLDIESERRTNAIVRPRQMWAYLARVLTPSSFPHIGRYLGGRDHTTVLHAYNKMKKLSEGDTCVSDEIASVRRKVEVLFNCRNNLNCFDPREI